MAAYEEMIFLIQFSFFIGLFVYKLARLLNFDEEKTNLENFITFILATLIFGVGFITSMFDYSTTLTSMLFKMQIPLYLLMVLFLIIDLFTGLHKIGVQTTKKSFNAKEFYAKRK